MANYSVLDHQALKLDSNLSAPEYWKKVLEMKNGNEDLIFPNLRYVIHLLLVLPFSNASVEQLFSSMKLTKNEHRNRLDTNTLCALLHIKQGVSDKGGNCVSFEPTRATIKGKK